MDDLKQATLAPAAADTGLPMASAYRGYVLGILVVVYTFNFIDRQILGILAVPIKTELGLSDSALGMLGGLAFALFYTLLGIPIARLADRVGRVRIIAVAVGLWSFATATCGAAHSFAQLFLARLAVGVGEAGGVAPAYSLICDYFPSRQRARALAVYSFGIPIGRGIAPLRHSGWARLLFGGGGTVHVECRVHGARLGGGAGPGHRPLRDGYFISTTDRI